MKILVVGGTGKVGSALVRELLARGHEPRVFTRDPKKAEAVPRGAHAAIGDLNQIETVRPACRGMEAMFLLNGLSTTEAHEGLTGLNAAMLEGVSRIVYVSVQDLESAAHLPHFGSKIGIEEAVRRSGIPWTILRPNSFFQNQHMYRQAIVEHGIYPEPIGTAGISRIDVRDIAEAAAIALTSPGHDGRTFDLDAWEAQAKRLLPAWLAFDLRRMYEHFQRDGLRATSETVASVTRLLGHPPREFEPFVREIAS
jgi:uncharacterized protein YbjT (DUF2867 family)